MIKSIPNFPDYFADEEGNIYSIRYYGLRKRSKPKKLSQGTDAAGYKRVNIINSSGKKSQFLVHRLILLTFAGECPKDMMGCHGINGKRDNSIKNLYWATSKQNCADKYRDGTQQTGERQANHRLNELQVRIVKRSYKVGDREKNPIRRQQLADAFGVSNGCIQHILYHEAWKHIK